MTKPNGWTDEGEVVSDEPVVEISGTTVKHNAVKWRTAKNRHSNTDGSDWGWIERAPGNVCWSNNSKFNRASAEKMVGIHNQWLEDQKPLSIKLIEARERRESAARRVDYTKSEFDMSMSELARCDAEIASLTTAKGERDGCE